LQAFQALGNEAFAPAADGVAIEAKLGGNFLVGWVVRLSRAQEDTAAENQGLGRGAGADQGFELGAKFVWQLDDRAEGTRHSRPPGKFDQMVPLLVIMATYAPHG
jgi:hypothetical protein